MSGNHWQGLTGQNLGASDWFQMDQARINLFAEATLDDQFIHVDPVAAAETPFGGTIAHGLLTLSMVPHLLYPLLAPHVPAGSTSVNYGIDRLRFLVPVKNSDRIRLLAEISSAEEKEPGRALLRIAITVEIEGSEKPALVAETLVMMMAPE
ncbi:MaoC family dehydratase [Halioxenophilus sp. WMMB6]|uniref:MaoC family dehydratase n=1 Tax=Halioxenophilus sp. WMMB6 TaxID=3073815 RepID=UPI00295ED55D|nr:MaoC family dehydratase [Halioxenophilus sp. WMMB6]